MTACKCNVLALFSPPKSELVFSSRGFMEAFDVKKRLACGTGLPLYRTHFLW